MDNDICIRRTLWGRTVCLPGFGGFMEGSTDISSGQRRNTRALSPRFDTSLGVLFFLRDDDPRNSPEADGRNEGHLRAGPLDPSRCFNWLPIVPKQHLAYLAAFLCTYNARANRAANPHDFSDPNQLTSPI